MNKLIDNPFVHVRVVAARHLSRFRLIDKHGGIGLVRGRGIDVKLRGSGRIVRFESYFLRSHTDVHTFLMPDRIFDAVENDRPVAADIDEAEFTPFEKISRREFLGRTERKVLGYGHNAARYYPVLMRIHEIDLVFNEDLFDEIFFAKRLRVVVFRVVGMVCVSCFKNHIFTYKSIIDRYLFQSVLISSAEGAMDEPVVPSRTSFAFLS